MDEGIAATVETGSRRDVLVVDDDRDLADSLAQLLRLEGYTVETAYSAGEAVAVLRQHQVVLALVDIRLGQSNGFHLIRQLRTGRPEMAAIMMTAYASVDTAVQAIQEGAYDYLCKPFFTEDLLATLRRCFERSSLLRERKEAETALRTRNRELKELNGRLAKVLRSMQSLARSTSSRALCRQLASELCDLLQVGSAALYLREGETLRLIATRAGDFPETMLLPSPERTSLFQALAAACSAVGSGDVGSGPCGSERGRVTLPLPDSRGSLLGAFVFDVEGAASTQHGVELGEILASFGAEAIQAARASEDLAESQERLCKIVENSPSAIAFANMQGCALLTNKRFEDWFGDQTAQTGAGDRSSQDVGRVQVDAEPVMDTGLPGSGRAVTQEVEVTLTDGVKRAILVTKFPVVDGRGEAVGVGTIGTDITEQRLAEHRLRQAQRMEAIGQLTGGVAHDFNNLLSVILGNLRLLQEETNGQPDVQELLEEALEATKAGAELTGRLLAVGRGQTLRPQRLDVRALVLDMSRMLERTLGEGIAVRVDLASNLWHAEIDRNQLETSLLNLAINARDAMPNGGSLLIRARNTVLGNEDVKTLSDVTPGDYVMISVADSGEGMSGEVLRQALQPFFTTKDPGDGSGLGLSIVYGFVKQSKGHLELASEVGRGTTVSLYFPVGASGAAAKRPDDAAAQAGNGRGERILVVEDHASVRRLMRRLLQRLGYNVLEAADGQSALRVLEERSDIDALLTDIVLPGETNGLSLGRTAVAAHAGLRVIYMTGYSADVPNIGEHPQDATIILLQKPIQVEELSRALRAALDGR